MGILSRIKAAAGSVVSVDDDLDFQSSQRAKNLAAPESPNDAFRDADYTPENDVHDRYTDGEAANAAPVQSVNGQTGNVSVGSPNSTQNDGFDTFTTAEGAFTASGSRSDSMAATFQSGTDFPPVLVNGIPYEISGGYSTPGGIVSETEAFIDITMFDGETFSRSHFGQGSNTGVINVTGFIETVEFSEDGSEGAFGEFRIQNVLTRNHNHTI